MWQRGTIGVALALAALTYAPVCPAWVETATQSDFVTIDLSRDGSAMVAHDILLQVRGGPLRGFALEGIDPDAELLSDATVAEASTGIKAQSPLPLLVNKSDDGSLRLEVDHKRGLRRGTYLFRFRYRTNMLERSLIQLDGSRAQVNWVGPRFADGLDSVKVVFRVPPAPNPPRLPEDRDTVAPGAEDQPWGIFLSTLRRAGDKDELEVVRPHVAKGEPVVWRIETDSRAFSVFAPPELAPLALPPPEPTLSTRDRVRLGACTLGVAFLYGLLVTLKSQALRRACSARRAKARPLVPWSAPLRGALSGGLLVGAASVALWSTYPTLGGALFLGSMLLAAHVSPGISPPLRGPGKWLPLSDEEAFNEAKERLPGQWLDATTGVGFLVFALALAAFVVAACAQFAHSPYHALLIALGSACLVPVFCTGRCTELPLDPATQPRRLLQRLKRKLERLDRVKVVAWARIPKGEARPDELRLLVLPRPSVGGLSGIEVAMEYQSGGGGPLGLPCVLVRALDRSPAHRKLEHLVQWTRGRHAEEVVAVLRPKLPTFGLTYALVERVAALLIDERSHVKRSGQPPLKTSISRGASAVTSKGGTTSSPIQRT